MATGLQRLVRRALLARLKANAPLNELVPAGSMNPPDDPSWPFIILRSPVSRPIRAAKLRGQEGAWDVHAFAREREIGGQIVETGEDHCSRIGAAIEACLADNNLPLEGGGSVRIMLSDMRLDIDERPGDYHYSAQVNWRAMAN